MTKKYGDKIAVGVDAIKNRVAIHGWKTVTDFDSVDFCRFMYEKMNVSTIVYTDISKDGMLSGTNLEIYKKLSEIKGLQIIASGGITYIEEIRKLASANVYGAILGKSIYAGKIDLAQAIQVAKGVDG
jgi:phosphoribosylformimino-5-aminoimidazole carboxamide ribotide isomerase